MTKYCIVCKEEINPLRVKALPHTKTCVNHSSTEKKTGYTVQLGEGDHTYNDIIIIEPEQRKQFEQLMQNTNHNIDPELDIPLDMSDDSPSTPFNSYYDLDKIDQPEE